MSSRDRIHELVWDSQTTFWSSFDGMGLGDSNLWMMAEDLGFDIWGQFNRKDETNTDDFSVIEDCSPALADLLVEAIPDRNGYGDSLSSALGNFAMMVAREIVLNGELDYELCFGRSPDDALGKPAAARLHYIPHGSLVRVGRRWFQVIPNDVDNRISTGQILSVKNERVIRFLPSVKLQRVLARVRAALPAIGQSRAVWMQRSIKSRSNESFADVSRSYDVALARATREIGWNGRGMFNEQSADFHLILRQLRWKRFCIEIRDQIIATLSRVFTKVGLMFGESSKLQLKDLPTRNDVDNAEKQLKAGGTRFDLLLKRFIN